jgi:AraC-like DNA-binding protein
MIPTNTIFILSHLPFAPGCQFKISATGHLVSHDGCNYNMGNYTCWHIVKHGYGTVRNEFGETRIGPGDMFSILPDERINYFDDPATPWEFYWIILEGPAVPMMSNLAGFTRERPWVRPKEPEIILSQFHHIWLTAQNTKYHMPLYLAQKVLELLMAFNVEKSVVSRTHQELVEQAEMMLKNEIYAGINVNELAQALHVDRTTLFHAFRTVKGIAPGKFIRDNRLERVRNILSNSDPGLTLEAIAAQCGYSNVKYFIRAFKQAFGMPPGCWRDRLM